MRENRDIKLVTTKSRRNYLVPEPNQKKNILAIKLKETRILMNKSVYLGLAILQIGTIIMYEFWYHYVAIETYAYGTNKEIIHKKKKLSVSM